MRERPARPQARSRDLLSGSSSARSLNQLSRRLAIPRSRPLPLEAEEGGEGRTLPFQGLGLAVLPCAAGVTSGTDCVVPGSSTSCPERYPSGRQGQRT